MVNNQDIIYNWLMFSIELYKLGCIVIIIIHPKLNNTHQTWWYNGNIMGI
jgi:hypothetical protein